MLKRFIAAVFAVLVMLVMTSAVSSETMANQRHTEIEEQVLVLLSEHFEKDDIAVTVDVNDYSIAVVVNAEQMPPSEIEEWKSKISVAVDVDVEKISFMSVVLPPVTVGGGAVEPHNPKSSAWLSMLIPLLFLGVITFLIYRAAKQKSKNGLSLPKKVMIIIAPVAFIAVIFLFNVTMNKIRNPTEDNTVTGISETLPDGRYVKSGDYYHDDKAIIIEGDTLSVVSVSWTFDGYVDNPLLPPVNYTFQNNILTIEGGLSANIDGVLRGVSTFPCEYKDGSIWIGGYFFETSDEKVEYKKSDNKG